MWLFKNVFKDMLTNSQDIQKLCFDTLDPSVGGSYAIDFIGARIFLSFWIQYHKSHNIK